MLTIAGGIILGFLGIVALVLAVRFFLAVPVWKSIGEGFKGFMEGMRKPPKD
jgi:hypothetical protein